MKNYTFHQLQILRTPLKPLKISFSKEELLALFEQKEMQEALFLASPNLLNKCRQWLQGYIKNNKEEKKLQYTLLKYALRMHSRCTPFGLFAACGTVPAFSENITLTGGYKRTTRLDMHYTCALAQELSKHSFIQQHLLFYPNTSIYIWHNKVRYVEYYYKNKQRIHQISAVEYSEYVQRILQIAKNGATLSELAQSIVQEDIEYSEALAFVEQMVQAQLLVSELEPAVTGNEMVRQILDILTRIQSNHPYNELQQIIELLQQTLQQLDKIDTQTGNSPAVYIQLAEQLKQLDVSFELSKLFQTDLFIKNIQASSPHTSLPQQLNNMLDVLNRLTTSPKKTNLSEFQEKFYNRYEDKEVPLLEALDTESGIGYAQNANYTNDISPLIENLYAPAPEEHITTASWSKQQSFLLNKLIEAYKNNEYIIEIKPEDVKDFPARWDDLADSFSVMYKHLGIKNNKPWLLVENIGGTSATYLLGRFAASHNEISHLVKEIAQTEQTQNKNVIYAEIVHLPESRTGNILLRPSFRNYEIPYLSNSTLPQENIIRPEDLYLSIQNNRLVLRSKRLNKEIIPRLGNAHNYSFNALPVYHFLCDLQSQNMRSGLFFDWGNLTADFTFLPRVEIENIVVSPATWQLQKKHYNSLLKTENAYEQFNTWKKQWKLPDSFVLADGDNELLIDTNSSLSVEMFIAEIKKRPNIVLKEFLFDKQSMVVKNEENQPYANEFITILQKIKHTTSEPHTITNYNKNKIQREFSIGDEWLYYKIYCGIKTADEILTEIIKPLTEKLIADNVIDYWFFIRYADPDAHIRVRFHLPDTTKTGQVISLFKESIQFFEKNGLIWKTQTDTYKREIERYGANTMVSSEKIFYYDSVCIANMLNMIEGYEGEKIRWLYAIRMVDTLLDDFNYALNDKKELLSFLKTAFAKEFNMNKDLKMQLDKKYRLHKNDISNILNQKNDSSSELLPILEYLYQKSKQIQPISKQIVSLDKNNQLEMPLDDLLSSYIHMLLNRLFRNNQRFHEMVIYDFMYRYYRSEIAKQKYTEKSPVAL